MPFSIHVKQSALSWSIGSAAAAYIKQNGFQVDDIDLLVGASGGPKWLVLAGLDRVLFGEFLPRRQTPLPTLASSIGSWRHACMAQSDPLAALDRFLSSYLDQSYPEKVTVYDVSQVLDGVLSDMLGASGVEEILAHPIYRNHIVAIRSKWPLHSDHRVALGAGLSAAFVANAMNRHGLNGFCQRVIFGDCRGEMLAADDGIDTRNIALSSANLELVLRASGAVPLVLAGVRDIPGSPAGVYRDGGITDYHFDSQMAPSKRIVFYPHFYNHCIPGWFDKVIKGRHLAARQWSNVVLVSPSDDFIKGLPGQKIPDRKDFFSMGNGQRKRFWKTVVAESERLGEAFLRDIEQQRFDGAG